MIAELAYLPTRFHRLYRATWATLLVDFLDAEKIADARERARAVARVRRLNDAIPVAFTGPTACRARAWRVIERMAAAV